MKDLINEIETTDRWMAEQFQRHDYRQMYEIWNKFKVSAMTQVKNLAIHDVSVSLPTKDEVCAEGYRIANDAGYNYRRVLRDQDHDIYYSGWMDCFDWISKGNER